MVIAGLHDVVAFVGKMPEMSLEKSEADLLSNAAVPVLAQFNVTPDPRIVSAFALCAAIATVEGPRIYLIRERMARERAQSRGNQARPVGPSAQPDGFSMPLDPGFFGTQQ